MPSKHIVQSFEAELARMRQSVARMGELVQNQVQDALAGLTNGDDRLAQRAVSEDQEIDAIDLQMIEQAVAVLALRQPMAADLREVLSALKIPDEFERIGDLAKGIARRSHAIKHVTPRAPLARLKAMGALVADQLERVRAALAQRDAAAAEQVWRRDRELLTYMMEDPRTISACTHLMFIAKNLERMGDHCTHIAEMLYFVVKGERLRDRPKGEDPARGAADLER